jgi:hypothetical protein
LIWDSVHKVFTEATGLVTSFILFVKHGDEVWETVKGWFGLRTFFERSLNDRRHTDMGLSQDFKLAVTFIPMLEKIATDAKTLEQTPATTQLVADVQSLIAAIKAVA